MKYTKQYKNETAYNADNTRVKPNVSYLTEDDAVKYNPYSISGRDAKAGTIVLAKTSTPSEKIFVPYESWDAATYSSYTPIGVVVVPFTHTLDNTVRIMSLKNMCLTNPNNGSTATNGSYSTISFYWGGYGTDAGLNKYTYVPNISKTNQSSSTVGSQDWVRIPSNYVKSSTFSGGVESTLDEGSKYYVSNEDIRYGVSPYVTYNWKSYEALSIIDKTKNAMLDYDGSGNTATILALDNAVSTDWQTASTITNNSGATNVHAPAQCCWRYSTLGTSQGQWYLPACGELAYLPARYADINEALTKLMTADSTLAIRLWRNDPSVQDASYSVYGNWLWSSTEYSASFARYVGVCHGLVNNYNKYSSVTANRVRAFAALTV